MHLKGQEALQPLASLPGCLRHVHSHACRPLVVTTGMVEAQMQECTSSSSALDAEDIAMCSGRDVLLIVCSTRSGSKL